MKKIFYLAIPFALFAAMCSAQSDPAPTPSAAPASPASSAAQPLKFAAGSTLPILLTKSVDAKKVHTGDPVMGKIPHDLSSNGKVLVAQDSKVIGHVAEVKASDHDSKNSMLGIVFDKLAMKDGSEVPLTVEIQAVGAPPSSASAPMAASAPPPPQNNPSGMNQGSEMGSARNNAPVPNAPNQQDTTPAMPANTPITSATKGVVGYDGYALAQGTMQDSVITSQDKNVKLDSGSQILLRTK